MKCCLKNNKAEFEFLKKKCPKFSLLDVRGFDPFVCFGGFVQLENFSSNRDVTITGKGLQILT